MDFFDRLEAAVEKARPLSGKKKEKRDKRATTQVEKSNLPAQFAALKEAVSSKINSKILDTVRLKASRLSQKELLVLHHQQAPKVIAALLVDLKVISKKDQLGLQRKLASLISKK